VFIEEGPREGERAPSKRVLQTQCKEEGRTNSETEDDLGINNQQEEKER
jgi:hypothetical protein